MKRTIRRAPITKMYYVTLHCQCGGTRLPTGFVLPTFPQRYPHRCTECGAESVEERQYPYVDYEVEAQATEFPEFPAARGLRLGSSDSD